MTVAVENTPAPSPELVAGMAALSALPVAEAKEVKKPLTRIYVVEQRTVSVSGDEATVSRLVRASHPSQVYMHLAKTQYDVGAASADTVADLMTAGVKLEIAGE